MLANLLLFTSLITKPIHHFLKLDEWAFRQFLNSLFLVRENIRFIGSISPHIFHNSLNGEVHNGALGDHAGGRLDGDRRRSGRCRWDEDVACTGTTSDKADGEDKGSEQTNETEGALLAG
jgi:hypothetical protein